MVIPMQQLGRLRHGAQRRIPARTWARSLQQLSSGALERSGTDKPSECEGTIAARRWGGGARHAPAAAWLDAKHESAVFAPMRKNGPSPLRRLRTGKVDYKQQPMLSLRVIFR